MSESFEAEKSIEEKQKDVLNKLHVLCGEFVAFSGEEDLSAVEEKAFALSKGIAEIQELIPSYGSEHVLEHAGDILVNLIGYLDLIKANMLSRTEAIVKLQKIKADFDKQFA